MARWALKGKDYKPLYEWLHKAKELLYDPCYIRKSFAFHSLSSINHKNFYREFKKYTK